MNNHSEGDQKMFKFYQRGKLSLTVLVVIVLAVLVGGCVGIRERFESPEGAGRIAPLKESRHQSSTGQPRDLKEVLPKEAELDDLLTIIRDSPQYREMRDRLLSEIPTDVRYCQLEDLGLAAITFTLAKEKTFIPNHFILAPAAVYYVDLISRQIVEIVIRQINEETLDEVQLTFLKHPENNKTIRLKKSVTEMLKTTKQAVTQQGGKTLICWFVPKPGEVNRTCKIICMAGCISACAGVTRWLTGPCVVACDEFCGAMCTEGTLGVECTEWDSEFTPM